MALTEHERTNFDTLERAAREGSLALMEFTEQASGARRAAVCAMSTDGERYTVIPFAFLIEGNPFELLKPPGAAED